MRTRASVWIQTDEGVRLLIDSGPEIRLQSLRERVTHVDAVLYTHFHADHTGGIDDLKAFNAALGGVLPCYGDCGNRGLPAQQRFAYAFAGTPWVGLIPHISYTNIDVQTVLRRQDVHSTHPDAPRPIRATGYRIGNFAYLTDTNGVPGYVTRACCTAWTTSSSTRCAGRRTPRTSASPRRWS